MQLPSLPPVLYSFVGMAKSTSAMPPAAYGIESLIEIHGPFAADQGFHTHTHTDTPHTHTQTHTHTHPRARARSFEFKPFSTRNPKSRLLCSKRCRPKYKTSVLEPAPPHTLPRPPNYAVIYLKYPLLRTIRAPLKGTWGGSGKRRISGANKTLKPQTPKTCNPRM